MIDTKSILFVACLLIIAVSLILLNSDIKLFLMGAISIKQLIENNLLSLFAIAGSVICEFFVMNYEG